MDHISRCPDDAPLTCATVGMPEHWHHQGIRLARWDFGVNLGLGRGFVVGFGLPLDLKDLSIAYALLDGTPYEPPYGDIHHRNDKLFGPGDGRLSVQWVGQPIATPLIFAVTLGTSLPFGKTEENPAAATANEEWHEHVQFGSGTFVPAVSGDFVLATEPIGLFVWGGANIPLYANTKGYKPGLSARVGVAPTLRPPPPLRELQLMVGLELGHEGTDRWGALEGENAGRDALTVQMAFSYSPVQALTVSGTLRASVLEVSHHETISLPVTLGLSVSGHVQLPRPGAPVEARPKVPAQTK